MVLLESGTALSFCAADSQIIVGTKSMIAGSMSSSLLVCGFFICCLFVFVFTPPLPWDGGTA